MSVLSAQWKASVIRVWRTSTISCLSLIIILRFAHDEKVNWAKCLCRTTDAYSIKISFSCSLGSHIGAPVQHSTELYKLDNSYSSPVSHRARSKIRRLRAVQVRERHFFLVSCSPHC